MNLQDIALAAQSTPRSDGWTPDRMMGFLECLCEKPDVGRACARVGLSRQSAYKLRRRDPLFAAAWQVALQVAHEARLRRAMAALPKRTLRTLSTMSGSSTSRH
ncbi:MAG TPA: hypothetical protein VEB68_08000 [Croceibacterium sp.]|nr:hypothetical protein [Croceibacterium sp.]